MGSKSSAQKAEICDKKLIPDSETVIKEQNINKKEYQNNSSTTNNKIKIIEEPKNIIDKESAGDISEKEEEEDKKQIEEYLNDIFSEFSFDFYDDTLDPNFLSWINSKKDLVFFDSKRLSKILYNKLRVIANEYPKHYEDLKQPLDVYMQKRQNKIYKENRNIFQSIGLRLRFIIGEESFNEDIRRRIKRIAFLLSQINADLKENKDKNVVIFLIDPDNYKVLPFIRKILNEIEEEIDNSNILIDNIEEINKSLNILEDKLNFLYKRIENDKNNSKEEKKIFKSFLAYKINRWLKDIEKASNFEGTEAEKKLISLKNHVNKIIFQNLDTDSSLDQNPFLGNIFKVKNEYTIIKDTKKEKKILFSGMNVEKFINTLKNHFEELKIDLSKLDDESEDINTNSEEDINFIQKKKSIIKNLEEKKDKNKKSIIELNQKMFENGIDIIKNTVENFDVELNEKENNQKKEFANKNEKEEASKSIDNGEANEKKEKNEKEEKNEKIEIKMKKEKKEIIENTFKSVGIIGGNIFQMNKNYIDKKSLEKKEEVYNYLTDENVKLINLYQLIKKYEKKAKKKKHINNYNKLNGLLISKNINSAGNELLNNYGVQIF